MPWTTNAEMLSSCLTAAASLDLHFSKISNCWNHWKNFNKAVWNPDSGCFLLQWESSWQFSPSWVNREGSSKKKTKFSKILEMKALLSRLWTISVWSWSIGMFIKNSFILKRVSYVSSSCRYWDKILKLKRVSLRDLSFYIKCKIALKQHEPTLKFRAWAVWILNSRF